MEKIDKAIEILTAFKEGKIIKGNSNTILPKFNLDTLESICSWIAAKPIESIEIAKEPTYRPYANAEEFLKASKEHGHYVKLDTGSYHFVDEFREASIHIRGYGFSTFTDLKQVFVWADTLEPCGILVQ